MNAWDWINEQQQRITVRPMTGPATAMAVSEADNYLRDGGAKFRISAPPLRVRALHNNATLSNGAQLPEDLLQLKNVVTTGSDSEIKKLAYVNYESFHKNEDAESEGGDYWSFDGNTFYLSRKHGAVELSYLARMPKLPNADIDTGEFNWVWQTDRDVYIYFVVARQFEIARNIEKAKMWFDQYAEKIVRLNRTYGDHAVLKGARLRYRGAGQLGRRYPKYW